MLKKLCASSGAVLLACVLSIIVSPQPASAYLNNHCKRPNTSNAVHDLSAYTSATQNATDAWNATPTPIFLDYGALGGDIVVRSSNDGSSGYDGITYWGPCSGGVQTTSPTSYYNTFYTASYGSTARKQVMVHELGHAIGLGDIGSHPACSGQPIMYESSDRWFTCNHQNPQTDDENGVDAIY